jgi:hypothetical protein
MVQMMSFSFRELRKATKGFDKSRLLGKGGSGTAYLGKLKGKLLAIKEIALGNTKEEYEVRWGKGAQF